MTKDKDKDDKEGCFSCCKDKEDKGGCSSCCEGYSDELIADDEWGNLLLKLELDLRSQTFFFYSYLMCIKSLLHPETRKKLQCEEILDLLSKMAETPHGLRPCTISAPHLQRSANALAKERKRILAARRASKKFDYLTDYFNRSSHDIPASISPEEYLSNFGGEPLYSIKIGPFVVESGWLGQIRMKADSAAQCLDLNIFRFNPHFPEDLVHLEQLRCEKVSQFIFCHLPRFEVSRLLRLSIPMDHIEGLHILKHPDYSRADSEDRQAILVLDLIHPINFYTRRVNCTQIELNKFKPRKDFGHASAVKRYYLSGTLSSLSYVVATLQNVRPSFVCKYLRGVKDVADVEEQTFAANHPEPLEVNEDIIRESLSDVTLDKLVQSGIINSPAEGQDPLENSYPCFRDFVYRVKNEQVVLESLDKDIPELNCKVSDYVKKQHKNSEEGREHEGTKEDNVRTMEQEVEVNAHPEQTLPQEHQYYSFCFGRMSGEEYFHCYKCGNCAGKDHWHNHKTSPSVIYQCMKCKSDSCITRHPHPLSGKLNAPLCGGRYPMGSEEDADASGVDDDDTPAWPIHDPHPSHVVIPDGINVRDDLFTN